MFRFSIRDVLWLTVVVGLAVALAVTRAQFSSMRTEIEHQSERLFHADSNIRYLSEGWQKDRPDRIELEDDYITINGDDVRMSFGRPLRPK
jgi:hypothetical protein